MFLFVKQKLTSSVNIDSVINGFKNAIPVECRLVLWVYNIKVYEY